MVVGRAGRSSLKVIGSCWLRQHGSLSMQLSALAQPRLHIVERRGRRNACTSAASSGTGSSSASTVADILQHASREGKSVKGVMDTEVQCAAMNPSCVANCDGHTRANDSLQPTLR